MEADIKTFLEIEKKYDLYHIEIEEIQCWQYVRFQLWNYKICAKQMELSSSASKQGIINAAWNVIKSMLYLLLHPDKRKLQSSKICFIAHGRRMKNNGVYECLYTDRLKESYYSNAVTLEKSIRMKHFRPTKSGNLYYTDFIDVKGKLKYLIQFIGKMPYYKKIRCKVHESFGQPIDEIIKSYNLKIDRDEIEQQLTRIVLECRVLKKYYNKLLDKIQPKVIVEVVGYSKFCMLINELAEKREITTIELQHGTMHCDHAAYQYAKECGHIAQFPSVLFVFSEYWKHCINVPIKDCAVKATGYPYFEEKLKQYALSPKREKINILFISQGTIGKELSRLAVELLELLDKSKYHIIYKLHPDEYKGWKERYPWLHSKELEIVGSMEHNIYEYFSICDIQVGVYSTAIYEGLGFGLKTFIYRIGHADTMKELCSQEYGSFVEGAGELMEKIVNDAEKGKMKPEVFWKKNALENMRREIGCF